MADFAGALLDFRAQSILRQSVDDPMVAMFCHTLLAPAKASYGRVRCAIPFH